MTSPLPAYAHSIHHDGSARYVKLAHTAEPALGDTVNLRLRAGLEAPIERVLLRLCPDGEQRLLEMQPENGGQPLPGSACRWWQQRLTLNMPLTGYRFILFTSDGVWWFNAAGLRRSQPTDAEDFRLLAGYQAPAWVRSSVFYQIFPDRFADGDPASNVRDGEFEYRDFRSSARRWGEPPSQQNRGAMLEFYGGDLPGVSQHLDYLEQLGVNAIYLNPIFGAYSNHRYDVTDYDNVDSHLGGNAALTELRQALSARQMRYILDIVPNHCGFLHPWFTSAQADPQSPSAEFFTFHQHPDEYESWLGVRSLPKLNYRSPRLREVMYAGPQSIFRRWLRPPFSADGWRIDVANMLARQGAEQMGLEIGRGIRQAVKEEDPGSYLMGENFFDGSSQLQGDCWDAIMNYAGFTLPLWWWLSGYRTSAHGSSETLTSAQPWPTEALVETWQTYRAAIPWSIARQQFNLLGSHDTGRALSLLNNDPLNLRLAASLLMTYPGVPCIYYGDEIGMRGENPGAARACMIWDTAGWDQDMLEFYRRLVRLRRSSPALIDGGFQVLWAAGDTLAYLRDSESELLIIVARRSGDSAAPFELPVAAGAVPNGIVFRELFSGAQAQVSGGHLSLPGLARGAQIWQAAAG